MAGTGFGIWIADGSFSRDELELRRTEKKWREVAWEECQELSCLPLFFFVTRDRGASR